MTTTNVIITRLRDSTLQRSMLNDLRSGLGLGLGLGLGSGLGLGISSCDYKEVKRM